MLRAARVLLALLTAACVVGSTADAAGTGWHVTPVRSLGKRIGAAQTAAVSRYGTSIVVLASGRSLTVARRAAHSSRFEISRRAARAPIVLSLAALADGRFLVVYASGGRLLARGIDRAGRLRGRPHVLEKTGYTTTGRFGDTFPSVVIDSDASRAVVVWGPTHGTTDRVVGAIDGPGGWSGSKIFYGVKSSQPEGFLVHAVHDSQDRFLVSVHGANGDTTAVMWGLPGGSRQWEQVTPPQAADGSAIASANGVTLASVDGAVTAAWQDASAALVVSTWDGSTWATPVTAIPGSHAANGLPIAVYPRFVSDGSRAAIVWCDQSNRFIGRIKATIRAGSTDNWSAPLVFPHSRCTGFSPLLSEEGGTFWFTASGALAGVWPGDPITGSGSAGFDIGGLYVGRAGAGAASATALSRTQSGTTGRIWFALPRAGGLHTIVWADAKGREYSATATRDGVIGQRRALAACGYPTGFSNPGALPQLVLDTPDGPVGGNGSKCPAVLLW